MATMIIAPAFPKRQPAPRRVSSLLLSNKAKDDGKLLLSCCFGDIARDSIWCLRRLLASFSGQRPSIIANPRYPLHPNPPRAPKLYLF